MIDFRCRDVYKRQIHKEIKVKFIEGTASFMSLVAIALVIGLAFCIERIIYSVSYTHLDVYKRQ